MTHRSRGRPFVKVELLEELHSNTRRTRITYRALVDGQPAAIKCYRKPLFGLIHWIRALRRGQKIRKAGGPVPPIVFSGWVASERCFGYGTAFLEGYRPLRAVLTEESSRLRKFDVIRLLGQTLADAHQRGIEQPDGNLTNFLMGSDNRISMVDEDDIVVHSRRLNTASAVSNLANVAARLPEGELVSVLSDAYIESIDLDHLAVPGWDDEEFSRRVEKWRKMLNGKRNSRNISQRRFD